MAERVSVGVLWIHLNNYGAAEFSSGRLKGKLFAMADPWLTVISGSVVFGNVLRANCSRYRFDGIAAVFAIRPLYPQAWTLSADIQNRISRSVPKTICSE